MSICTRMIFSTQQHHYLPFQWGHHSSQVAACVSQYIWAQGLFVCLGIICYIFFYFCHSTIHSSSVLPSLIQTPKPPPALPFPPSAAIVISLPSTGPLIWLGWHVPRLYLTLAQINSWTNLWRNLPQMSLPLSSSTISVSLPLQFLPLQSASSPTVVISLPLSAGMNPCSAPHFALSPFFFYLSPFLWQAQIYPPHSLLTSTPPPLNPTCSHRCVAPIYGFITAAIQGKRKVERWKERGMERDKRGKRLGKWRDWGTHDKDLLDRTGQ